MTGLAGYPRARRRRAVEIVGDGTARIVLARGEVAIIDAADARLVSGYSWQLATNGYVITCAGGTTVMLHRLIDGTPKGFVVDHKNHDKLDNRRDNLRRCTQAENARNRAMKVPSASRYKGVTASRTRGVWKAGIKTLGKQTHLGCFDTEEAAARAYDTAARKAWGEYALPNFNERTEV